MNDYKSILLASIKDDLGANYFSEDDSAITALFEDVLNEALSISNLRDDNEDNVKRLFPEIRKCVKTVYLQRGSEDVTSQSISGLNSTYDDAIARLRRDIIGNNKRVLI